MPPNCRRRGQRLREAPGGGGMRSHGPGTTDQVAGLWIRSNPSHQQQFGPLVDDALRRWRLWNEGGLLTAPRLQSGKKAQHQSKGIEKTLATLRSGRIPTSAHSRGSILQAYQAMFSRKARALTAKAMGEEADRTVEQPRTPTAGVGPLPSPRIRICSGIPSFQNPSWKKLGFRPKYLPFLPPRPTPTNSLPHLGANGPSDGLRITFHHTRTGRPVE